MFSNISHIFRLSRAKDEDKALADCKNPAANKSLIKAPRYPLAAVIAVVGCDGSGKSTLTADLSAHFRGTFITHLMYLGQGSGNILRSILRVPLIGPMLGRYLVGKSKRAHKDGDKSAEPDITTALVIYALSRWRRRKFRQMLALQRAGTVIITDRYPQAEVAGFYFDGPGLVPTEKSNGFVCWLAARERRLYEDMASYVPTIIVRLNIDAEAAHARKPDHKLAMLRDKTSVIPTLTFNCAPILDLDGTAPYAEVLATALAATKSALNLDHRREAPG